MADVVASEDEIPDLFPAGVGSEGQEGTAGSEPLSLIPAPRAAPSARRDSSARAPAAVAPPFGGSVSLGDDWDDFGGAATAQLNVDVSGTTQDEEEVPWPKASTPSSDELAIEPERVTQVSGFGPSPESILMAPVYTVRVMFARRRLRGEEQQARATLEEAERLRDERLAALAEDKRAGLKENVRFSRLYEEMDRHDQSIRERRAALERTDAAGARTLAELQAKIEGLIVERNLRERTAAEQRAVLEEADRGISRGRAALKKIDIQWRNVETRARAHPGKEMPDELDRELDLLEEEKKRAGDGLQSLQEARKEIARLTAAKDDELRWAAAAVRRAEGEKEALLLTHAGDVSRRSDELEEAIRARRDELAGAARAILHLRGEIPVSPGTRRALLQADEVVHRAAVELETVRRAQVTVDANVFERGRVVLMGVALTLFVGILVALVL